MGLLQKLPGALIAPQVQSEPKPGSQASVRGIAYQADSSYDFPPHRRQSGALARAGR
jgi:hypothetical protein